MWDSDESLFSILLLRNVRIPYREKNKREMMERTTMIIPIEVDCGFESSGDFFDFLTQQPYHSMTHMAVMLAKDVILQYDRTKHVENNFLLYLNKNLDEYPGQDRIILSVSCDFEVFCHFIDFLISKHIPSDRNDQNGVINQLREWESHFGILECFRFRPPFLLS